ncbi:hypothetical protein PAECIP111893_01903 [Paenibacillus plantiphilus]|uniref:4-amino-4-deoxychorismate lyase n=1 Tax=Paenibacillus plantiphilus TaxID=2905650 RepID=A0ABM9C309_9BACL|nr:aminotransferase class IV [Paenibacillus plantiphilus]CAH1202726.1 hypothetical protein PAECIP111893_01903 [Paenibacillus plantiphilus]
MGNESLDIAAFQLLETILLEDGAYSLLEQHINRMMQSAAFFGFNGDEKRIRVELADYAASCSDPRRVRLLLDKDGTVSIESQPYVPLTADEFVVCLAARPVPKDHVFLQHKTTNRQVYVDSKQGTGDVFDVLLWNEDEEITEFTIGNVVAKMEGRLVTPPIHCGLLPGTLRAALLSGGVIEERAIRVDEIGKADALWLINSLRGWIPVRLEGQHP